MFGPYTLYVVMVEEYRKIFAEQYCRSVYFVLLSEQVFDRKTCAPDHQHQCWFLVVANVVLSCWRIGAIIVFIFLVLFLITGGKLKATLENIGLTVAFFYYLYFL